MRWVAPRISGATQGLMEAMSAYIARDRWEAMAAGGELRVHARGTALFADISGFPPAFINVGNGESLRDDSLSFHSKLTEAGLRSELLGVDGMEHVAPVRSTDLPGSAESFEAAVAFVTRLLG